MGMSMEAWLDCMGDNTIKKGRNDVEVTRRAG